MPQILQWFFASLFMLMAVLGNSDTVDAPPVRPSGVASPPAGQVALQEQTLDTQPVDVMSALVSDELLDLLLWVPDTPENRRWLALGDAQAWHEATDIPRVSNVDKARALPAESWRAWSRELPYQTLPPPALGIQYLAAEDLRDILGFNYFDALQYVDAGVAPDNVAIVEVGMSMPEVGAALEAAGYEFVPPGEMVALFRRGEEYGVDFDNPSPTARLGTLNRVVVTGGLAADGETGFANVLIARADAPLVAAINAWTDGSTLLDDPYYKSIVSYIGAAPDVIPGKLVGALFLGEMPVGDPALLLSESPESAREQMEAQIAWLEANPLSPWMTTALTTHREGADTYLSAYVAFPPGASAYENAQSLAGRLSAYTSRSTGRAYSDFWELYATDWVSVDGVPVARVTMRMLPDQVAQMNWARIVAQRDDLFLVPAGAP